MAAAGDQERIVRRIREERARRAGSVPPPRDVLLPDEILPSARGYDDPIAPFEAAAEAGVDEALLPDVETYPADPGWHDPRPIAAVVRGPKQVFGRSLGVVLLWHAVPLIGVGVLYARVEHNANQPPCVGCNAGDGTALTLAILTVVLSLAASVTAAWFLATSYVRRPNLVGNLAALPGMALTAYVLYQSFAWLWRLIT